MSHLTNIENRQRTTRIRDAIFAFVALGAIISVTAISTVAHTASTHQAAPAHVVFR